MALAGALDRRSSLIGAALGLIVGGMGGFVAASPVEPARPPAAVQGTASAPAARSSAAPQSSSAQVAQARPSFAQQGEDLVIQHLLFQMKVRSPPTYLDIGAHEPVLNSNTYLLYALGGHGVLVEPNPTFVAKLRATRPRDVVLEHGIGVSEQAEADYYVMTGNEGQLNTFSKTQADTLTRVHQIKVERVLKRRLVPINAIMEQHFKDRAPDVLSVDVEGLDLDILETLDWQRWRPLIVCVETSTVESGSVDPRIFALLEKQGYAARGGSFVNTIFLDERTRRADVAARRDAGPPGK